MKMSDSDVNMETALAVDTLYDELVCENEEEKIDATFDLDTAMIADEEQDLVKNYYIFLVKTTTLDVYAQLLDHCVDSMDSNRLPRGIVTLRTCALGIINALFNLVELVNSTIPVIRLKTMISHWMGSRAHSLAIKKVNDITNGILDGTILPPQDIHGPMWTTKLWASTARSAMPESLSRHCRLFIFT